MNIINDDGHLESLLKFYSIGAFKFYGPKYENLINYVLNNLNICLFDKDVDNYEKSIKELFYNNYDQNRFQYLVDNKEVILKYGLSYIDYDSKQLYLMVSNNHDIKTELQLIKNIFVSFISSIINSPLIINDDVYLRSGFSFINSDSNNYIGYYFNEGFVNLITENIYEKCYSDLVTNKNFKTQSPFADEFAKFIYNIERKNGYKDILIDSFLTSQPFVWDVYNPSKCNDINYFNMVRYIDILEINKDFNCLDSIKKELTLYKRLKK